MYYLQLLIGILLIILAIYLIKKEPRRLLNGILIELGVLLSFWGGMFSLFPPERNKVIQEASLGAEIIAITFFFLLLIIFLVGVVLIANGYFLIKKEGISLTNLLPIVFGASSMSMLPFTIFAMLLDLTSNIMVKLIFEFLFLISLYIPFMFFAFIIYSVIYLYIPKPKRCDFIIVHGCSIRGTKVTPLLKKRLDKAIDWYEKFNKKPIFITSGGQGHDEIVSEAWAMKKYLIDNGINEKNIIMEDKSTTTLENLKYSKNIMLQKNKEYICAICTNNYHVLRTVILAKSLKINCYGIGCKTAFYYLPAGFFREFIAIIFKYKALAIGYLILDIFILFFTYIFK